MILKHTEYHSKVIKNIQEENYKTMTSRKYLHLSPDQLMMKILLVKINLLLVNFNVWKMRLEIQVSSSLIWHPTKNCHFGPLDHLMYIFLCSSLNENLDLIEPKTSQPNECL